jgi:hypothetical protein
MLKYVSGGKVHKTYRGIQKIGIVYECPEVLGAIE